MVQSRTGVKCRIIALLVLLTGLVVSIAWRRGTPREGRDGWDDVFPVPTGTATDLTGPLAFVDDEDEEEEVSCTAEDQTTPEATKPAGAPKADRG